MITSKISSLCLYSRTDAYGQVVILSGLLLDEFKEGALFHVVSWMYDKTKRPIRSVPAAETLAAAKSVDEGKTIKGTYNEILSLDIELQIFVDSKDLYNSLST